MKKSLRHVAVITIIAMIATLVPVVSFGASVPAKVRISGITQTTSTNAKVIWKKVSKAKGYQVYRATAKNGTYKRVATTKNLSYTNKGLTTGKTYYYKVRAFNSSKKYGKFSTVKSIQVMPVIGISMPKEVGADGAMTFTVDSAKNRETLYFVTSLQTTFLKSKLCSFIVPDAYSTGGDVDENNLMSFEFVSAKNLTTGKTIAPTTYQNFDAIEIPAGQKLQVKVKYMAESTAPLNYNYSEDALAFYSLYKDDFYAVVWLSKEGVVPTKME